MTLQENCTVSLESRTARNGFSVLKETGLIKARNVNKLSVKINIITTPKNKKPDEAERSLVL